ncbi:MAG: class I SAM-dependent methyltransferase [Desulfovibrio sp.]|nr:MAG: class I SAM-dependent methyltransferase [Desulfovibrio sp.]
MDNKKDLAEYFQVSVRLVEHLDYLLWEFTELGGMSHLIARLLQGADIAPDSRVLDLGCGKGAVGLSLLASLPGSIGHVTGVDAYAPFVREAQRAAQKRGLAGQCRFLQADIREYPAQDPLFDCVLYVSVGNVLGDLTGTMAALRSHVRPGGYMVVDDGYLAGDAVDFPGYEDMAGREETLARLTAHGDELAGEVAIPAQAIAAQNKEYFSRITSRAQELAGRFPDLAHDIENFVRKEQEENTILERHVRCATWLLRRAS